MTQAFLFSANLTNASLAGANLTNAGLSFGTLTNANLTGATVAGASFGATNLTASQLYSTASYQAGNLQGINLAFNDLTGWNFSGQNLTERQLYLHNIDQRQPGGSHRGWGRFRHVEPHPAQLYSTASYLAQNLQGIGLESNNLTGWNFSGQNLANANLSYATLTGANFTNASLINANLGSATLTDANLTGADLRGAQNAVLTLATTTNTIFPDGTIQGLNLDANNPTLLVRNYSGSSSIPIHVLQGMSMNPGTSLVFQFDGNAWGSTISFDSGILVTLGGNIELGVVSGVDPSGLLGQSLQLFNWTGVSPSGQFAQVVSDLPTRYSWDTSALYTVGKVALTISVAPINGQWATNGSGTWGNSANWSGGNVPGAPQDTAVFGTALTSGTATVTLDTVVSLASLSFSPSGGAGYAISPSGASTLTLSNTAGSATIGNSGGNNLIAVPITLESNLSVSASAGSTLTIAAAISESGGSRSLGLSGNGELILSDSNAYSGGTVVNAGTLVVTSAGAPRQFALDRCCGRHVHLRSLGVCRVRGERRDVRGFARRGGCSGSGTGNAGARVRGRARRGGRSLAAAEPPDQGRR